MQLLLYKRLLFELDCLHDKLQTDINTCKEQICDLQSLIAKAKRNFYTISSNLYPISI